MKTKPDVAVYYFPNYHADARNQKHHGADWTEWELVRCAKPRFRGHDQPRIPAWGETDEADPAQMAHKIDAAADHGIDAFIFDWYWYNDGPYLERGLEQGFMNAPNNNRLRFALMWANHDWIDIHPMKACDNALENATLLYPGAVTPETFETIMDVCIERYFKHPSYWQLDGCPYFSIYELAKLIEGFGSVEKARELLDLFRKRVRAAGFRDLHLNAVIWNKPFLPGESTPTNPKMLVDALGFDSVTSYVWIHHYDTADFPTVEYNDICDAYLSFWEEAEEKYEQPYYPNVTVGWDASPRTVQSDAYENRGYPFMYTIANNTPDNFKKALELAKKRLEQSRVPTPFLTINAWNEWTEGSYLEPDLKRGMSYLDAVREVFEKERESEVLGAQKTLTY